MSNWATPPRRAERCTRSLAISARCGWVGGRGEHGLDGADQAIVLDGRQQDAPAGGHLGDEGLEERPGVGMAEREHKAHRGAALDAIDQDLRQLVEVPGHAFPVETDHLYHPSSLARPGPRTMEEMGFSAREFSARFWSLIGATFLGFLGMGTVLPGLAPHVRHTLGGSDQTVGFIIGTFSFVALGARFFSGPLADRRGSQSGDAVGTGELFGGGSGVPCCRWESRAPSWVACCRASARPALYTGAAAWAVELAGVERSGQALGYLSSAIWGGISAGPVIGPVAGIV